jgi:hypothetical protein
MFKAEFFNKLDIRRRKADFTDIRTYLDFGETDYLNQEEQLLR